MSSSTPVSNIRQPRTLLQTMYNFLLPLIQTVDVQTKKESDVDQILSGIEAEEFVTALEDFMSGVISRSRMDNRDVSIEVAYDNLGESDLVPVPENQVMQIDDGQGGNDILNKEHIPKNPSVAHLIPRSFTGNNYAEMEGWLKKLRSFVTENFPIRILCFEPQESNLNISLMEKADIYNYLAPKFEAHYNSSSELQRKSHKPEMHILGVSDFEDWLAKYARYAILSHTWNQARGELTYANWKKGSLDARKPIFQKVANFCKAALNDYEITFGWIDSVCINKDSSAELDESIRSMYMWYHNAAVCITYLAETTDLSDMPEDPWFTRGWTFQELIAPPCLKFYSTDWRQLNDLHWDNDKEDPVILGYIKMATGITREELHDIQSSPISRRMQLAAERKVTREEDTAYCLMGIFGVSISTEYGEGAQRAFFRLVKEIFDSTKYVLDIFNWGGIQSRSTKSTTSLFPSSPRNYLARSLQNFQCDTWRPVEPLTLTHLGLRTTILLIHALSSRKPIFDYRSIGDYSATLVVSDAGFITDALKLGPRYYHLMDKRVLTLKDKDLRSKKWKTYPFGILNVEGDETHIYIPTTCFAALLELEYTQNDEVDSTHSQRYRRKFTKEPIIFTLKKNQDISDEPGYHKIKRSQLKKHGMQLVTLYL